MVTVAATIAVGWTGKLPTLGDFATRRLDAAFVEAWDAWLSAGLAALRQQDGWLERYLASPSWRFLLMPGVLPGEPSAHAWAGVLMPSVDRVGRYYPLTLAHPLDTLPLDDDAIDALWLWLLKLDEAAVDALHDDWDIETLDAELARIGLPPQVRKRDPARPPPRAAPEASQPTQRHALTGHPHAGTYFKRQAAADWYRRTRGVAFWYADAGDDPPTLFSSPGLQVQPLVEHLFGGR